MIRSPVPDVREVDDLIVCDVRLTIGIVSRDDAAHLALLQGNCAHRLGRLYTCRRAWSPEHSFGVGSVRRGCQTGQRKRRRRADD